MTTSTTQSNDQLTYANLIINEMMNKETKAAFMNDFQEFALDEDMDQFNLELIDDIDPLVN
jgi:hypothetical protein